jgi:hypothetical protein
MKDQLLKQVKIWRIDRPIQNFKLALHLLQPLYDELAGVSCGAVLKEELCPMDPYEWRQVILQNGLVNSLFMTQFFGKK